MDGMTPETLARFDGENGGEIYISFDGKVYDVSDRRDLYGKSPPGPYHALAGRECARALSTMSLDLADVGRRDLEDIQQLVKKLEHVMSATEVREAVDKAFRDWQRHFEEKYPAIGVCNGGRYQYLQGPPASFQLSHPVFRKTAAPWGAKTTSVGSVGFVGSGIGPLRMISRKPRIYLQSQFLQPAECQMLMHMILQRKERCNFQTKLRAPLEPEHPRWTAEQRALILKIEDRVAEISGAARHQDETALVGTLTPPQASGGISEHLGLHVDTNAAHWRFCTAIIYLSTLGAGVTGGETVFPVALDPQVEGPPDEASERVIEAAGELLDLNLDHTDKALHADETLKAREAATDLLAAADAATTGIRVKPEQGSMCVFWTRQDDGEIDRFSWHGGAPLHVEASEQSGDIFGWKWTLQKFKQVPVSAST